jgi:hypothetical protein
MARRMLGGGVAERPEFVGLFSNNVLEERVMRLMEGKSVLTARAKMVRLASGATAMATATLMATSFHVIPTMAAASVGSPVIQTAMLRATVPGSADVPVVATVSCPHRLAKPAVAPSVPAAAKPVVGASAPVSARALAVPIAVGFAAQYGRPEAALVAFPALQSAPATAPTPPVATPALPAAAPVAPAGTPVAPEVAPPASAAPTDKEKNKKKNSYVYQMMDPDGSGVVIINGKARALTPEEKKKVDEAMEQFKNGDFAKHMADMKREMAELKTLNSEDFREKMEAARREFEQNALANNAELRAKIQAMMKNFDTHNMYVGPCKDGFAKDKDKDKQKSDGPVNQ